MGLLLIDPQPHERIRLPLAELSQHVPHQHTGLTELGLHVDTNRLTRHRRDAHATPETVAGLLDLVSTRRAATGDRVGALASSTEAVAHYRQLAQANPAVFLPDLAGSLNNLSNRQSDTGDRDGALASISEAVAIRRQLAQANPAVFLPDLATSLNNLSNLVAATGDGAGVEQAWRTAISDLAATASQAELRTEFALWLHRHHEVPRATSELVAAAQFADTGRVRHHVRSAVQQLSLHDNRLPAWATTTLPDHHLALLNTWANQLNDWPATESFLRANADELQQHDLRATLTILNQLYLDHPVTQHQVTILDAIHDHGIEAVMQAGRRQHEQDTLINEWIGTATWPESAAFLTQHRDLLLTEDTIAALAANDHPTAQQHAAVLYLATSQPIDVVYQYLTEPATALDAAMTAIEHGDLLTLGLLTATTPTIRTHRLITAVLALAEDDEHAARDAIETIAQQTDETQRHAAAIRLRALARCQPDLATAANNLAHHIETANDPRPAATPP